MNFILFSSEIIVLSEAEPSFLLFKKSVYQYFISALPRHRLQSIYFLPKNKKPPAKRTPRMKKSLCHLAEYHHTPSVLRAHLSSEANNAEAFSPLPSAVHLIACFLPDSQHRRLSVKASLPLSPPQRFSLIKYSTVFFACQ